LEESVSGTSSTASQRSTRHTAGGARHCCNSLHSELPPPPRTAAGDIHDPHLSSRGCVSWCTHMVPTTGAGGASCNPLVSLSQQPEVCTYLTLCTLYPGVSAYEHFILLSHPHQRSVIISNAPHRHQRSHPHPPLTRRTFAAKQGVTIIGTAFIAGGVHPPLAHRRRLSSSCPLHDSTLDSELCLHEDSVFAIHLGLQGVCESETLSRYLPRSIVVACKPLGY